MREKIRKSLERHFRPEFLNRLDEVIIFSSLTPAVIQKIVEIQLERVRRRMEARDITISFTAEFKKFVAENGYDPQYGARPLKRAIQTHVLDLLAQEMIAGKIREGDAVLVDVQEGKVTFGKGLKRGSGVKVAAVAAKS